MSPLRKYTTHYPVGDIQKTPIRGHKLNDRPSVALQTVKRFPTSSFTSWIFLQEPPVAWNKQNYAVFFTLHQITIYYIHFILIYEYFSGY